MEYQETSLREFGQQIQNLIKQHNLSRHACYDMFRQIMAGSQPDLHQGAFLAALAAKGETTEEIAGAWQAIVELDTCKLDTPPAAPLVENSGTGMDSLKTFNVSTAAAIIAAAGGVRMARHGARALTSKCGTVDILDRLGINVDCPVELVGQSIDQAGIGIFNGMSPQVHPNALFRILSQIRFGSTLNIAASLASPCCPTHGVRGVYAEPVMNNVVHIMKAIGYQRAMVVHGYDDDGVKGMDEISTIGETAVQEFFPDGSCRSYRIAPEELNLKRGRYEQVAARGDIHEETVRFMQVIGGLDHPGCIDLASANAGAIFYISGQCDDLPSGVAKAQGILHNGQALEKLCHWVTVQCDEAHDGLRRFTTIAQKAGLKKQVAGFIGSNLEPRSLNKAI